MLLLWLICFITVVLWLALRDRSNRNYWRKRGVRQVDPVSLFNPLQLVNSFNIRLPQVCKLYYSSDSPLLGFYKGRSPVLMVRDPELVCAVMRTDFQHFTDKRQPIKIDKGVDPLSQHLIGLTGDRWKAVRSKLTPVFSSGKIKEALPLIEEAVDSFVRRLDGQPIDIFPSTVTLVSDVILSYAFGLELDSPERPKVRSMGFSAIRPRPLDWRRALRFHFPRLFSLLGLKAFDPMVTGFFTDFVREALTGKRKLPKRADFLVRLFGIAQDLPEKDREGLLAAQVFSFFVAGFETTCFTLSSCLYELCKHPDIVRKARQQLDELVEKHGSLNYEAVREASYVSQIIKESMRLYPADYATPRVCTKAYRFEELGVTIEEGTELLIPGFCLSRDEHYYPRPLEFNPDRFSDVNKAEIIPGTYLPFGEGPRQCIAVRFSMLELEYVVSRFINEYNMELAPETPECIELNEHTRVTHFKGKVFIKFIRRNKKW